MEYLCNYLDAPDFEDLETEYKLKLDNKEDRIEKWAKTICGFANCAGGTMFVGVADDGAVIGLEHKAVDEAKNLVLRTVDRHVFPHVPVILSTIPVLEDRYVLSVYVDAVSDIVIYRSGDYNEKVYIRENGATLQASVSQILALGRRKNGIDNTILNRSFEKKAFSKYFAMAKRYRADGILPSEELLISENLVKEDLRITSGFQMFSDDYSDDNTLLVCRLWKGMNKGNNTVQDRKEMKGSICNTLQGAMDFIARNSRSGFIKMPDGSRLDTESYPKEAIREVLVNAIAHRDYSIDGSQIDVDIFPDRIEIMSPGSWLLSREPAKYDLQHVPSIRRNKIICNGFFLAGLMEKSGTGFRKIASIYQEKDKAMPLLEAYPDFFVITLYDLLFEESFAMSLKANGPYQQTILQFCKGNARTREEIQELIGVKSRSYFSIKILAPLVDSGLLLATAPERSRNRRYVTNEDKIR